MRTLSVVITSPRFNRGPRLSQAQEPVCIQALVTKSSVERLDITVLHGLAGINKAKHDVSLLTPGSHRPAHKFGSMIHPDLLRPASACAQLLQDANDAQRGQARIHFNR